ncbi:hypothetical protein M419DRAFT_98127 [Trichoderma reesei RUT C-30]|uniref:Uncharacterized protein n=1 Tax=Hypocrea jecorina (strain ATCC 56765 / BCRC 32924 / NRRL 11460 / Rut C-30) TaxID=1344414 RepID=A0A024SG10_HYPJR|nr:hypothetical protein M419DRAFT_98127 [Trichoderma reesei RUT C-30]
MAPMGYSDRDGHLEAGLLRSDQGEKQTGHQQQLTQTTPRKSKMVYLRRALVIVAVGFVLGLGVATARPGFVDCHRNSKMAVAKAHGASSELVGELDKTSPDLLHRLLHAYLPERYQHGVFASDAEAIDAIHENDPSVASAIVQIAKRQEDGSSNSNTTIPSSPSSTAPPASATESASDSSTTADANAQSTTDAPSSTPTPSDTSAQQTSTPDSTSSGNTTAESTADTSSASAPASTTAEQTTAAEQTTTNAPSTTAAPSTSQAPSTTDSASEFTATASDDTITSTTAEASETPKTTITSGSKTTSAPVLHTYTRTLPDGGTTTMTSTSWVAVLPTSQADGSKSPDLQNAASVPRGQVLLPAAIGLLAGAVLMV